MAITIELPHVGESVVEGTIGKWLKQPGDQVRRYEPLVEVVTDKVTMEVPSPVSGSLLKILAQEGETIPMGAHIAEMESSDPPPPRSSPALPPDPSQAAASHPAAQSQPEISTAGRSHHHATFPALPWPSRGIGNGHWRYHPTGRRDTSGACGATRYGTEECWIA